MQVFQSTVYYFLLTVVGFDSFFEIEVKVKTGLHDDDRSFNSSILL